MLTVISIPYTQFSQDTQKLENLKNFLLLLKNTYPIVLPENNTYKQAVTITFDHASFDFYKSIFPFLETQKIPVVVGVACRYISKDSNIFIAPSERTVASEALVFQDEIFLKHHPFCSQKELLDLYQSPYVKLGSSGLAIRNLIHNPPYLQSEIIRSHYYLHQLTGAAPKYFFFPFGKYDHYSAKLVQEHYDYSFVLGNSINHSTKKHLLYRLNIKNLREDQTIPHWRNFPTYFKNWILEQSKVFYRNRITKQASR